MTSLAFPDINVWFSLTVVGNAHSKPAWDWFNSRPEQQVAFCRYTELGLLRVLTTAAAMHYQPLTMREAWAAYDKWFLLENVIWMDEPYNLDSTFRKLSMLDTPSPKLWNDLYIAAFAHAAGGTLVTFDQALHGRAPGSVLLR